MNMKIAQRKQNAKLIKLLESLPALPAITGEFQDVKAAHSVVTGLAACGLYLNTEKSAQAQDFTSADIPPNASGKMLLEEIRERIQAIISKTEETHGTHN